MKVLIAPWGNPTNWQEAEYRYNGTTKRGKSSIGVIIDVEKPDKTIIVCSDTLSNEVGTISSYRDIKIFAEKIVKDFAEREFNIEPDVIVSYSFGKFRNLNFEGNASDFYVGVLLGLVDELVEVLKNGELPEEFEFILDLTHGLNFNTVMTYQAVLDITSILAYFTNVKLKVLNSDPFNKNQTLNINTIQNKKVLPSLVAYNTDEKPIKLYHNLENNVKEELGKKLINCSDNKKEVMTFLSAFIFGLPVHVITYMPNVKDLRRVIKLCYILYECNIKVSGNKVLRMYEFTDSFTNMVKAYFVGWLLEKMNFSACDDVQIDDIIRLKKTIYKKFPVIRNRIDREIDEVEKIREKLTNQYQNYSVLLGKNQRNIDLRNFFAHAGFEHNALDLRINQNKIEIMLNTNQKPQGENLLINALLYKKEGKT
ncbi:MAG: CRISPR-associated CARF protein Csx1 [candidate division WOR-3 bacterium]